MSWTDEDDHVMCLSSSGHPWPITVLQLLNYNFNPIIFQLIYELETFLRKNKTFQKVELNFTTVVYHGLYRGK